MRLRIFYSLLEETFNKWNEDKVPRLGAALAYYSVFSIAPLLLLVIGVAARRGGLLAGGQLCRFVRSEHVLVRSDLQIRSRRPRGLARRLDWSGSYGALFHRQVRVRKDDSTAESGDRAKGWAGGTGPPRRVLVVDDNVDAAQSIVTLLASYGHEVECAYEGYSALEKRRAFRPEIVVLDIGLPGMNGHEVARALRAQPEFKDLVLVAVTGYGQEEDRRHSQEAGFDFHLTKPVSAEALAAVFTSPRRKSMVVLDRNKN